MKSSGRIVGLDILRAIAILFVMVTHMFNYTGMLSADTHTFNWGVSNMLHYTSMMHAYACVILADGASYRCFTGIFGGKNSTYCTCSCQQIFKVYVQ